MRNLVQLLPPLVLPILSFFILTPPLIHAKSTHAPLYSLIYLPWDSKISEIASRFQVNISDILAANSINPEIPSLGNQILRANSHVKVPISCPCVDGIRRSMSTTYRVQEADTAESVSHGYGGIVSAEQITIVNGINGINGISHSNFSYLPKNRKVPPEIFDDVEGVDLAERGAPCHALFGFGLVVEPEGPNLRFEAYQ
ncbi:lysm domain-containing gpi-anchored protein 3 [Quercus suber]|uniref:Lysm domain-containing gpi-anchored protein 3 n=1 Tax=Quercus suber TaxID=58331 RepID=A0AAW0LX26_QUESU